MKTCSRCHLEMKKAVVSTIEVDECPQCKGLWFDDRELELAKDNTDRDLAWMDFEIWKHPEHFTVGERPLRCPGCRGRMVGLQYAGTGVTVDTCVACRGVWVEKGEFENIVTALTHELATKSSADYVRASLHEARELFTGPESLVSEWRDLRAVLRLLQLRFFVDHPKLLALITGIPPVG